MCRTALAVSGKDYVVIAADTRISVGYAIHTRHGKKLAKLFVDYICHLGPDLNNLLKITGRATAVFLFWVGLTMFKYAQDTPMRFGYFWNAS
jgi:hypothetical protein